jgi:uroporphyrin-III C-methyltransferase
MSGRTAVLLAAHGSRRDRAANGLVERLAADLAHRGMSDEVVAGFHHGEPSFAEALDRLRADRVLVVPLFTSEGYYTQEVLPRALQASRRYRSLEVTIARPFGTHPNLPALVRNRLAQVATVCGLDLDRTGVLVVGHGTRRHHASRAATFRLAQSLASQQVAAQVSSGFLDDDPEVEEAVRALSQPTTLVVPFLLGGGSHALADLPRRLGLEAQHQVEHPVTGTVAGRQIVLDIPVAGYEELGELVSDIVRTELQISGRAKAARGSVALVGAGPGDPGLITVKGLALLRAADVVLHDRLVAPELLGEVRSDATLIDVGKFPGGGGPTQQRINALIVEHASRGSAVVRLKGGDPFVFGRGAEELDACRAAGVPCAVVPGVTSATAAPAAAGIPVTARGEARSFTVVTAQSDTGRLPDAVRELAGNRGIETLVLLMGRSVLRELTSVLIAAGRDPATPAACIQEGTTSRQRVTVATLATLAEAADRDGLESPMVTVIGDVASRALESAPC